MAKLGSRIRQINRRIREVYEYFGERSVEYHRIKNIIFSAYGEESILISDTDRKNKKSNIRLLSGSKALEGHSYYSVEDIWNVMQSFGTVKQMAESYMSQWARRSGTEGEMKKTKSGNIRFHSNAWKSPEVQQNIQNETEQEFHFYFADDELYQALQEKIDEESFKDSEDIDEKYLNTLNKLFSNFKKGTYGKQTTSEIREEFNKAMDDHEEWLRNKVVDKDDEDDEDVDNSEYDMGMN